MKRFSEIKYIDDELLIDESIDIDLFESQINEEGGILNLAKLLGDKLHAAKSVMNDINKFGKNVKLSYQGFTANLANKKDTLSEEQRKEIYNTINAKEKVNEKVQEILKIWNDGINGEQKQDFIDSGFVTYMLLYGKQLASSDIYKSSNKENEIKELDSAISSIPGKVKKLAKSSWDKIKEFTSKKKEDKPQEKEEAEVETQEIKQGEEIKQEEVVSPVVNKNPIESLAQSANINKDKLQNSVYNLLTDDNNKVKWDINNANNIILGLSSIICGGLLLQNENVYNDILKACGIEDIEQFIDKIKNK